jgi:EVE domain
VRKFPEVVKLKELRSFAKSGGALENMQMLKQSRLSVSAVKPKEWKFIMSLAGEDDEEAGPGDEDEDEEEHGDGTGEADATLVETVEQVFKGVKKVAAAALGNVTGGDKEPSGAVTVDGGEDDEDEEGDE